MDLINSKRKFISEYVDSAYEAISKNKEGVFQSDLCKLLNISSREGSKVVRLMEKADLISRESVLYKRRRTFKLIVKKRPIEVGIVGDLFCFVCPYEKKCTAKSSQYLVNCMHLEKWAKEKYKENREKRGLDARQEKRMGGEEERPLLQNGQEGGL